jgi:hypothetical protein
MFMMRKSKNLHGYMRHVPAFMLAVLMSFQVYTRTVYQHVHQLSDGRTISHAHPFSKTSDTSPIKSHQHSSLELFCLQNLELLFPLLFLSIAAVLVQGRVFRPELVPQHPLRPALLFSPGRAPPV